MSRSSVVYRIHAMQKPDARCIGLSRIMAEREGFEPPVRCRTTDFESAAIDLSATSPEGARERVDYSGFDARFEGPRSAERRSRDGQRSTAPCVTPLCVTRSYSVSAS